MREGRHGSLPRSPLVPKAPPGGEKKETKKAVFRCDLTNERLYAIKKARRNGAAMEEKMKYIRDIAFVADLLAQSSDFRLRMMAWQLRDRLRQQPPITKQEALDLLRKAEREAALAAAWKEATQPRR